MSTDDPSRPADDFLAVAIDEGLLKASQAQQLQSESADKGRQAAELALELGLLTATQIDIVRALLTPANVAPGFEVQNLLGHGGLGVVYCALQPKLDRLVALKTIPINRATSQGVMERFQQEAQVVGRLHHPNIVSAYDYGTHAGRLYLAMELVRGSDLDSKIEHDGAMPAATSWGIVRQVASGLAHAAKEGIVHRDVKPANLLLTDPPAGFTLQDDVPMVKIADFGLARLVDDESDETRLTMHGTTLGTPQYMAPEQLVAAEVDQRADIYALGATAFHMLTGESPFGNATTGQILAMKARGESLPLAKLPSGADSDSAKLVAKMTAPDPEDRLADYNDLIVQIDRLIKMSRRDDEVGSADTLDALPAQPSRATATRRGKAMASRRIVGIGAGVITLVVVFTTMLFIRPGTNPDLTNLPLLVRTDWERQLSDGKTLTHWTGIRGTWHYTKNEENASVLVGSGSIERPIPRPDFPQPRELPNYGVGIGVYLNEATEVELQFWDAGTDIVHSVLLSSDGAAVGRRTGDQDMEVITTWTTIPGGTSDDAPKYRQLRVERHGTFWLAYFADHLLGRIPVTGTASRRIRLVVRGGAAHFDDLHVFELVPSDGSI